MRLLLTLVAVAMLTFAVGCGKDDGDAAADTSTSGTQTAGTQTAATTPDTSQMQLVSLKLPGMT